MKKEIIALCVLATLVAGCSEQSQAKPGEAEAPSAKKVESPQAQYRRSVPSAVTADEFNKAGMRGAKPAEAQAPLGEKAEEPKPTYRRSVPSAVKAEDFNKAGIRGAGSPQPERK